MMFRLSRVAFCLAAVLSTTGCAELAENVTICVDNALDTPMVVTIDSDKPVIIPPHDCRWVSTKAGVRKLHVESDGEVLYQSVRDFPRPDSSFSVGQRYLFNPDGTYRYRKYDVEYGRQSVMADVLADAVADYLPEDRNRTRDVDVRKLRDKLVAKAGLMPDSSWFEVKGIRHVLEDPPSIVFGKKHSKETRSVLTRMSAEDHLLIRSIADKVDPNEDDVELLYDTLLRLFEDQA